MHILLLILVALAAGFVWQTGIDLPPVVASHFSIAGQADVYTPRGAYFGLMLALVVRWSIAGRARAAQRGAAGWLVGWRPARFVKLPQREYWLAPERRAATIGSLCRWLAVLAAGWVVLLCFAHWRVVQANNAQ